MALITLAAPNFDGEESRNAAILIHILTYGTENILLISNLAFEELEKPLAVMASATILTGPPIHRHRRHRLCRPDLHMLAAQAEDLVEGGLVL